MAIYDVDDFYGMSKNQIYDVLDNAEVGSTIAGIYDNYWNKECLVEKRSGYKHNYFAPIGKPSDWAYEDAYWTINGSEQNYLGSIIWEINNGGNKYYRTAQRHIAFDIPDENKNGDCFVVAFENVMADNNLLLCHGIVSGTGPLTGIEFPHAWNETRDGFVIDESNGNAVCVRKEVYYSIGNIQDVVVYDSFDAVAFACESGTYGPWDDMFDFDYRMANRRTAYELDETNTGGDCFESAYHDFIESQDEWGSTTYLCHGVVRGKGKLEGLLLSHAWTETYSDEWIPIAADYSQGNEIVMPVHQYYDAVDVVPGSVEKYDDEWEVESLIAANGHLGPWHIDWYIKDAETGEIIDGVV